MWYTNIYSNIMICQKLIGTSIKEGCASRSLYASSGPKAEGVPTNNQRGTGVIRSSSVISSQIGVMSDKLRVSLFLVMSQNVM